MLFDQYDNLRRETRKVSRTWIRIVLFLLGTILSSTQKGFLSQSMTSSALGTITYWTVNTDKKGNPESYTVTVMFEDSDHRFYQAESLFSIPTKPAIGDPVTVRYDPRNPDKGVLLKEHENQASSSYGTAILFGVLFAIMVGAPMFKSWHDRREERRQREMQKRRATQAGSLDAGTFLPEEFTPYEWEDEEGDSPHMSI